MPARAQLMGFLPRDSIHVPPLDVHANGACLIAQSEMQVRAALAGMAIPAIHLARQCSPIGGGYRDSRADCRPSEQILALVTGAHDRAGRGAWTDRQQQVKTEEVSA